DRGALQSVLNVLTYLQISVQIVSVSATICVPHRSVLFYDTEANTRRIYFLTHDRLLLVSNLDRDVARPLYDAISTAFGTRHDALQGATFVYKHGGDLQVIHVCAIVVLGVGNGRLQHFLDDVSGLLVAESQQVHGLIYFLLPVPLALGFLVCRVTKIGTGGSEFAQLVADHVFGNDNRHMLTTVMYSDGQTDHLRQYHGTARPGLNRLAIVLFYCDFDLL